jgi:hypothetical protein
MSIPVLTPEGIVLVKPHIGWNAVFSAKDRLRWANLYVHLLSKGVVPEKAEVKAFQQVWQLRDPHLVY